jgi:putative addiction module component (TIGR02574 family)
MSANSEQILKQALALPLQERAELVEHLLATFQSPPDSRLDELWAREAEDRLDAYNRGELKAVSAEEVFNKIKERRAK